MNYTFFINLLLISDMDGSSININNYYSRQYDPWSSKISKIWYVWAVYGFIKLGNKEVYTYINPNYKKVKYLCRLYFLIDLILLDKECV